MGRTPFSNSDVAAKFAGYPVKARRQLMSARELVFETARVTEGVGALEETLRWNEPAYIPLNGAGSTLRMDWKPRAPDEVALYFNCKTDLIASFRAAFAHDLRFEGNRAILLAVGDPFPIDVLSVCIARCFTYRRDKATKRGKR